MAASEVSSILEEMGWDNSYSLPTANQDNSKLEIEVRKQSVELVSVQSELENYKNRIDNIKDHLKNIKNEYAQTQQLIRAKQTEIEAEDHMFQLAYREDEWLANDMDKLQKHMIDLDEKCQRQNTLIVKKREKLSEMNAELKIDEKALIQWLDEVSSHDDNVLALQRYTKQDEQKMKELVIKIRGLSDMLEDEKKKLAELVTEYRCCQMEMNKTAEEYSQLHEDRHGLIKQWEDTITQMKDRDKEINGILMDMTQIRTELKIKMETENTKTEFLNELKRDNQKIEYAMRIGDRKLAKLRDQSRILKSQMELQEDDLRTLKSQIKRCSADLLTLKEEIKQRREINLKTREKREQQVERIAELKNSLGSVKGDLMSSDQKANASYKYFQCMESTQKTLEFELNRMMDIRYHKLQELEKERDNEKTLTSEIQGCRTSIQNLKKRLTSLEKMAQRQDEVIYGQDVVIQQLEDRISRITGNTRAEEKKALENKVAKLEETLEKKESSCNFLNQQIKYLEDDVWRVNRALVKQKDVQQDLNVKMKDLGMEIDTANQEVKCLTGKKQDLIVEENILKLHIKKLKEDLTIKVDDVLSLEKEKLDLDKVLKEHYHDINTQHEMLRAQYNNIEEERHYLQTELNNQTIKISKLKTRYEVLVSSMSECAEAPVEDLTCHVHYFIRAVLEKQRLQLEGDKLDEQVLKAEREVTALENTLKLMNMSNDNLRRSFNPVTKSSEEHEEKQHLEDQLRMSREKQIIKKKERNELLNQVEQLNQACEIMEGEQHRLNYNCREFRDHMSNLGRRMEEQYAKLDRATSINAKYTKAIRPRDQSKVKILIEYDFDLRILRDANKFIIKLFEQFLTDKPLLYEQAAELFRDTKLPTLKVTIVEDDTSTLSVLSNASFCSSRGNMTLSDAAPSSVVNISFPDTLPSKALSLDDVSKEKFSKSRTGVARCGSEIIQTARSKRVKDARKAPDQESPRKPKSTCSVGAISADGSFFF